MLDKPELTGPAMKSGTIFLGGWFFCWLFGGTIIDYLSPEVNEPFVFSILTALFSYLVLRFDKDRLKNEEYQMIHEMRRLGISSLSEEELRMIYRYRKEKEKEEYDKLTK